MFQYITASLTHEFATEIRDLLLQPPRDRTYDTLKAEYGSKRMRRQLLTAEELGDSKLS